MKKRVWSVSPWVVTGISSCSNGGGASFTGRCGLSSSPETAIQPSEVRAAAACALGPRSTHATAYARSSTALTASATCTGSVWMAWSLRIRALTLAASVASVTGTCRKLV